MNCTQWWRYYLALVYFFGGTFSTIYGGVKQVHLLFRHGTRTPVHTFPTDPYRDLFRSEGVEQLMPEGVTDHHELGRFLRHRYGNFLPRSYNRTLMVVRSTDTDRTLMSAQANLAGLFADMCNSRNRPMCYPIPIHTAPKAHDHLLKMSSPCPLYKHNWNEFKSREHGIYRRVYQKYKEFFDFLSLNTGLSKVGISQSWKIGDPVLVWKAKNLSLPDWLDDKTVQRLIKLSHRKFQWKWKEPQLYKPRIGALITTMVTNMNKLVKEKTSKILYMYSAHDSTLSAFLHALEIFNNLQPPIASCVMVELYDDLQVKVFYRNSSAQSVHQLDIPSCPSPCYLKQLTDSIRQRDLWVEDPVALCNSVPKPPENNSYAIFSFTNLIIVFLLILLVVQLFRGSSISRRLSLSRRRSSQSQDSPLKQPPVTLLPPRSPIKEEITVDPAYSFANTRHGHAHSSLQHHIKRS